MENKFVPLESEQDVILFDGNTYIIWKFKKIITQEISNKFRTTLGDNNRLKFFDLFQRISYDKNQIIFPTKKMTWHSCFKCQILRVGSPKWQSGELRVKADIKFCKNREDIEIFLEFCDKQIVEYQSPLDDIREKMKT